MSAGMPAGATSTNQPSMVTPGTVSFMVGRSGRIGKRLVELTREVRSLPACTMALVTASDEISTGTVPLAASCTICAAER